MEESTMVSLSQKEIQVLFDAAKQQEIKKLKDQLAKAKKKQKELETRIADLVSEKWDLQTRLNKAEARFNENYSKVNEYAKILRDSATAMYYVAEDWDLPIAERTPHGSEDMVKSIARMESYLCQAKFCCFSNRDARKIIDDISRILGNLKEKATGERRPASISVEERIKNAMKKTGLYDWVYLD